jgi:[CysO sulfur-carrier protein]-S-L-cysteine hydrolase
MSVNAKSLYLTDVHLTAIIHHVNAHAPLEACGLLGGIGGIVQTVYPVPNIAARPDITFLMEPKEQVRAMIEIEDHGLEIAAIYHSHPPGSRTDPSATDLRDMLYPNVYMLIVVPSANGGCASLRAFVTRENRAVEVPIVINSDHDQGVIEG